MDKNKILFVIPARGGSKGIPGKNIKLLAGKPLIYYSIDVARELTNDENICVSTDDDDIAKVVENYGLSVPFIRPAELATDDATTNSVLIHAIDYYKSIGINYDSIVLLQPTSPFRTAKQVKEAIELYNSDLDMIVSVKVSHTASVLCNEDANGFIRMVFNKTGEGRQKFNTYYEYNGAIYVISVVRLAKNSLSEFDRVKKYVMDEVSSLDIDTPLDWLLAENIFEHIKIK